MSESRCIICKNHYTDDYGISYCKIVEESDIGEIDEEDFKDPQKCKYFSQIQVKCKNCGKDYPLIKGFPKGYCSSECFLAKKQEVNEEIDNIEIKRIKAEHLLEKLDAFEEEILDFKKEILDKISVELNFSSYSIHALKECFRSIENIIQEEKHENSISVTYADHFIEEIYKSL